ncbi:MAG: HAMP domain-containing sensor histidine kinase [Pseudomonadota bacterium]
MRGLDLQHGRRDGLLAQYGARMVEAVHVRRAALEAKAARVEAAYAIKARSQFLANMNHELRTPLNAIIGFASMLKDGDGYGLTDEKRADYATYILQSADLLLGHINTILEAADIQAGDMQLAPDAAELNEVVAGAARRIGVAAAAADVEVSMRSVDGDVVGLVDLERLSQALDHLLRVAVKMSDPGSQILVRASYDDRGAPQIAVRDFGRGLSEDEQTAALTALDAIDGGFDAAFQGPGVEYAIARTLIELQGGRLLLRSRPGKGALATLVAPRAPERIEKDDITNERADAAPERTPARRAAAGGVR